MNNRDKKCLDDGYKTNERLKNKQTTWGQAGGRTC